jgi:hypothetical protein
VTARAGQGISALTHTSVVSTLHLSIDCQCSPQGRDSNVAAKRNASVADTL